MPLSLNRREHVAFSPLSRSGGRLEAWYRSYAGVTLDANGLVQQINDGSGKGRHLVQSTAANRPFFGQLGNGGNFCKFPSDLQNTGGIAATGWAISAGMTRQSASLVTVTANNSRLNFNAYTVQGRSYTLSFQARRVTGSAAVKFATVSSASGDTQTLTINGVLTTYSVTFLGRTGGGTVGVGIQDAGTGSAATWGQLEVTNASCVETNNWDLTNIPMTNGLIKFPARFGKPVIFGDDEFNRVIGPALFTLKQPCTIYHLLNAYDSSSGRFFSDGGVTNNAGISTGGSGTMNLRPDTAPSTTFTVGLPCVISATFNTTSSSLACNLNAPVVGGTAGGNPDGFMLLGRPDLTRGNTIEWGETIVRSGIDDAQTRLEHIRYLANQWGVVL